ncbi:hypothetical protein [Streptomyces hawaiiensis]|uniref:hypothetical protein n=1 Tax=Streptomyces hawaiiensis TaxID=67305 RepID=UPI00158658FE|nr:hypothetical protein [Streptomyces hawaiiensis]
MLFGEPDLALSRGHREDLDRRFGGVVRILYFVIDLLGVKLTTGQQETSCGAGAP